MSIFFGLENEPKEPRIDMENTFALINLISASICLKLFEETNIMNNKIVEIMSFTVIIESLITYFKEFFVYGDFSFSMLFSLILGVIIAIAYKLDLPEYLDLKSSVPYVGNILTGILISRGSNYIYDILKTITSLEQ